MNYDQDRPSSRVICPPGGASSNIFGPPTVQTTNQKRNPISSIFNNDTPTEQVPKKSNPPGGKTHDVFGTQCSPETRKNVRASNSLKSTIFSNPEPQKTAQPNVQASKPVWHQDDNDKEDEENKRPKQENKPAPEPEVVKNHEPHLGPVKTTSGVKIRKPPGGGSSLTLG